jgi:hypothetical protein
MPMTEKQLLARDAKRDIGAELLLAARQLREGKGKVGGAHSGACGDSCAHEVVPVAG